MTQDQHQSDAAPSNVSVWSAPQLRELSLGATLTGNIVGEEDTLATLQS